MVRTIVPACSTAVMPKAFMAALAAWPAAFTTSIGLKPAATAAAAAASRCPRVAVVVGKPWRKMRKTHSDW